MTRILFYDNNLTVSFNYNTKFIIDYFDIESQKILPIIGYSFKSNPQLMNFSSPFESPKLQFDYLCNVKKPILLKSVSMIGSKFGVIYECYI